jgi:tellurite resistance protein TerC
MFSRKAHEVTLREAPIRSVIFISLALLFCLGLYYYMLDLLPNRAELLGFDTDKLARDTALKFLAGYVVEYALTGIETLSPPERPLEPDKNPAVRLIKRMFPVISQYHGESFWTPIDGKLYATPLFVTLVFIEFSDIIFAIDSVPAIFALTNEPFIVFTSNIFAIIGLGSLFFVLEHMVKAFEFLKYGLGVILVFVGLKMVWLNQLFGGKFPITWSPSIIGTILGLSILVSIAYNRSNAT